MRTTLALDDDVLEAARSLAEQKNATIGQIISDLARQSLRRPSGMSERNGILLMPVSNPQAQVTLDTVIELRDELG